MTAYNKPTPDYGDLMPVAEWLETCENGNFIDYDGYGYPVQLDADGFPLMDDLIRLFPSERHLTLPKDATHILWFNR